VLRPNVFLLVLKPHKTLLFFSKLYLFSRLFLLFFIDASPFVKLGVVTSFFQASVQMPPEVYIAI